MIAASMRDDTARCISAAWRTHFQGRIRIRARIMHPRPCRRSQRSCALSIRAPRSHRLRHSCTSRHRAEALVRSTRPRVPCGTGGWGTVTAPVLRRMPCTREQPCRGRMRPRPHHWDAAPAPRPRSTTSALALYTMCCKIPLSSE